MIESIVHNTVEIFKVIKFREFRVFEKFIHEKKEIYMVST